MHCRFCLFPSCRLPASCLLCGRLSHRAPLVLPARPRADKTTLLLPRHQHKHSDWRGSSPRHSVARPNRDLCFLAGYNEHRPVRTTRVAHRDQHTLRSTRDRPCCRTRDQHLLVEARFPGEKGNTTVDLSEGRAYLTDWVLIEEKKDGGMMRKKKQAAGRQQRSRRRWVAHRPRVHLPLLLPLRHPPRHPKQAGASPRPLPRPPSPSPDRAELARKRRN